MVHVSLDWGLGVGVKVRAGVWRRISSRAMPTLGMQRNTTSRRARRMPPANAADPEADRSYDRCLRRRWTNEEME